MTDLGRLGGRRRLPLHTCPFSNGIFLTPTPHAQPGVAEQLPKKRDNIVFCELRPAQKRAYRRVVESPDVQVGGWAGVFACRRGWRLRRPLVSARSGAVLAMRNDSVPPGAAAGARV